MPQIFLCHTEHAFQNYYGEPALRDCGRWAR